MADVKTEATNRIHEWTQSHDRGEECDELTLSGLELSSIPTQIFKHLASLDLTEIYLDYNNLTELPGELCEHCQGLQTISLVGNQLAELPNSVSQLDSLRQLFVNENQLASLPDSFGDLKSLVELNIVGNQISALPETFGQLENLVEVNADENKLSMLANSFGNLVKLEILELENNALSSLPENFGRLRSLRVLNLSGNKLLTLPESFSDLPRVEDLVLSSNSIETLPTEFESHKTIRNLYLDENHIVELPEWTADLPQCEVFDVKDNHLSGEQIHDTFAVNNKKLRKFEIGGNFITALPDNIGELPLLETFHMGSTIPEVDRRAFLNGNWIKVIPDSVAELVNLKHVRFDENELRKLPADFGNLIHLVTFDMCQNGLSYLPTSFCDLRSLEECYLSQNALECLPENLGNLQNLRILRLDHNLLTFLPVSMENLTNLQTLDLFRNQLTQVPPWIGKLTRLNCFNLDKNKLDMHYMDYPQLYSAPSYPERDPALKDNWRGRRQKDQVVFNPDQITEVESTEPRDDFYPDEYDEKTIYNSQALRAAVRKNMSLWRTHTSEQTERSALVLVNNRWVSSEEKENQHKEPDIDYLDDIWYPEPDGTKFHIKESEEQKEPEKMFIPESTEDWDAEIEELPPVPPVELLPHPVRKADIISKPKDKGRHYFLPEDTNPKDFEINRASFDVIEGQFEDAE